MNENSNFTEKEIWNQCSNLYNQHFESYFFMALCLSIKKVGSWLHIKEINLIIPSYIEFRHTQTLLIIYISQVSHSSILTSFSTPPKFLITQKSEPTHHCSYHTYFSFSLFACALVNVEKRKQEKKLKKTAAFCEEIVEEPRDGNGVIMINEKKLETKKRCRIIIQEQTKINKMMSYR